MNDDDLLGDFGDDFNILEFTDALDGNDSNKTYILDDLEAEDDSDDNKKTDGAQTSETNLHLLLLEVQDLKILLEVHHPHTLDNKRLVGQKA